MLNRAWVAMDPPSATARYLDPRARMRAPERDGAKRADGSPQNAKRRLPLPEDAVQHL